MTQNKYCIETLKQAIMRGCSDFNARMKQKEDPHYAVDQSAKEAICYYREHVSIDYPCSSSNTKLKQDWRAMNIWPPVGLEINKLKRWMRQLSSATTDPNWRIVNIPSTGNPHKKQKSLLAHTVKETLLRTGTTRDTMNELNSSGIKSPHGKIWKMPALWAFLKRNCPELQTGVNGIWVEINGENSLQTTKESSRS